MTKIKTLYSQFKKTLHGKKSILIVMHNFPDPDSIMSAFLLQKLAKFFKLKAKIVYGGEIIFEENHFMINLIRMKATPYLVGEEKNYECIAVVDHQLEMKNCPLSLEVKPQIIFDHHPKKNHKTRAKNSFYWIEEKCGTCCSMILSFVAQEKNIKIEKNIIAAYCYTVDTETNFFQRKYSALDEELYKKYFALVDIKKLNQLRHLEKKPEYFNLIKHAMNHVEIKNEILYCSLGKIFSKKAIVEIAEFFIRRKDIEITFVTGILNNKTYFSSRNKNKKFHIGNFLNSIKEINGGGHQEMAAGVTNKKEKEIISLMKKTIK